MGSRGHSFNKVEQEYFCGHDARREHPGREEGSGNHVRSKEEKNPHGGRWGEQVGRYDSQDLQCSVTSASSHPLLGSDVLNPPPLHPDGRTGGTLTE
ncbi:unnamed protein product [Lota lota]